MTLNDEQQGRVDEQIAVETARSVLMSAEDKKRRKLELVRLAANSLATNRADQPAGARAVSSTEIIEYATSLEVFVET
tara:strand:- start:2868 stop:3101 length:234 start_codon:yes stop_codon:yes gene_type:complete